ncbi:FAD-dependent oxidoreductase [Moorella sulfitireducens]|uniref:FAD-dependent oxidoreductase n=1 Tax=Neomoorella sulfitireducens TaxID=2972948 RepID=UPI0021AD4E75|nr:FAD-binding protein [Moorella sulfitireducens]
MDWKQVPETVLRTDVLIIGGGAAGMWAAKRLKENDPGLDVLMVDKGPESWGGLMRLAGGDFAAVLPGESVDDWVKDVVYYWDGLCEQDVMEDIFSQSYDRLLDYKNLGCEFLEDENGNLRGVPQRGLDHCRLYPAKLKGTGGQNMAEAMVKEMVRLGVRRMSRTLVTDLVKDGDRVIGAVGFHSITGEYYIFQARAVIVACGNASWKPGYNSNTSTGEWVDMCFQAGVELRNFETLTVMNAPKLFFWEGQAIYLALGGRFVNALGEPFMDKYSPVLGANTDNNYITRAMAIEIRNGRGPIYLDLSQIKPEDMVFVKPQTGNQMMNYEKLLAEGIDFFHDKNIEFIPQVQLTLGGAATAPDGGTGVEGLYVCGRSRSLDYVYMGGFGLSSTAITGYITGNAVADYLRTASAGREVSVGEAAGLKEKLYSPMGDAGLTPKQVLIKVQNLMSHYDVCLLKSAESLTAALGELDRLRTEELPRMYAADPHYLLKYKEVEGIFLLTELYLRASLLRQESRGSHYRLDYPKRNDKDFLGWIVQRQGADGSVVQRVKPVPLARYKHPVDRFYSDNFTF